MKNLNFSKIIVFLLSILFLANSSFGALQDSTIHYFNLGNYNGDIGGANMNAYNSPTFVAGKNGNGVQVSGTGSASAGGNQLYSDTLQSADLRYDDDYCISMWENFGTKKAGGYTMWAIGDSTNKQFPASYTGVSVANNVGYLNNRHAEARVEFLGTNDVNFHLMIYCQDYTNSRVYAWEDNVLVLNQSKTMSSAGLGNIYFNLGGTPLHTYGSDGTHIYDELAIFNKILDSTERSDLYNSGTGCFYGDSCYGSITTPTINYNVSDNDYLNYQPSILLNTTTNTNMSVVFNGASESSICNDCNSTNYNPTLIAGQNNFTFISNNENRQVNSTLTLFYDITNPTITNNNLNLELLFNETLSLNSNQLVSVCSDTYLDYCNISIYKNASLLEEVSWNNSFSNIELLGDYTYDVEVYDLAGNTNTANGSFNIDKYKKFFFYNNVSNDIEITEFLAELSGESIYINGDLDFLTLDYELSPLFEADVFGYYPFSSNLDNGINLSENIWNNSLYFQPYQISATTTLNSTWTILYAEFLTQFVNYSSAGVDGFNFEIESIDIPEGDTRLIFSNEGTDPVTNESITSNNIYDFYNDGETPISIEMYSITETLLNPLRTHQISLKDESNSDIDSNANVYITIREADSLKIVHRFKWGNIENVDFLLPRYENYYVTIAGDGYQTLNRYLSVDDVNDQTIIYTLDFTENTYQDYDYIDIEKLTNNYGILKIGDQFKLTIAPDNEALTSVAVTIFEGDNVSSAVSGNQSITYTNVVFQEYTFDINGNYTRLEVDINGANAITETFIPYNNTNDEYIADPSKFDSTNPDLMFILFFVVIVLAVLISENQNKLFIPALVFFSMIFALVFTLQKEWVYVAIAIGVITFLITKVKWRG